MAWITSQTILKIFGLSAIDWVSCHMGIEVIECSILLQISYF